MTSSSKTPQNPESNDWSSPLDDLLHSGFPNTMQTEAVAPIQLVDSQLGTPKLDIAQWDGQQSYPDTCAIRCQEFILEQFTGMDIDETALVREAMDAGWYVPGVGTTQQDVGNLLEMHGIAVNRYENASIFHLANELAQGHKVIVGVDSGEIWGQHPILESISDILGISGADHAVVISGIDTSNPDNVQVIVSDPGTGEPAAVYHLDEFVDAWRDSNCFMVATQHPAPPTLHEMANFDYAEGHIPTVWGMPYDHFLGLADQPDACKEALDMALQMLGLGWVDFFLPNSEGNPDVQALISIDDNHGAEEDESSEDETQELMDQGEDDEYLV